MYIDHSLRRAALLLIGLAGFSSSAWAEAPTHVVAQDARDEPSGVIAPRLLSSDLPYPAGARGDATVTLVVTVNADGTVRSARATDGEEPFASTAASAARSFLFQPATRNGLPIAAVIRLEATFSTPATEDQGPGTAMGGGPSGALPLPTGPSFPRPSPAAPTEVIISGEKRAPAVSSLSRAEVRQLPGAFGDPFRAIEALPGITPIFSGLPFFYVRGAPPGNVGYFVDGVRVPYLYHVALGPSVIHPGLVDHVDLYPGGYPAQYGRFAGGIVAGETKPPSTELHGEGNLRIFDVGAMVETGFGGGDGTILLGGRYSYTAAIVSLLVPQAVLDYRDYQARLSYDLGSHDRVSVFGFGSYDLFGQRSNDTLRIAFGAEFYRLDVRYDHTFDDGGTIRTAVTLGLDHTLAAESLDVRDRMVGGRVELKEPLSDHVLLRAGADVTYDALDAQIAQGPRSFSDSGTAEVNAVRELFAPRDDMAMGTYLDFVIRPTKGLEIIPGIRADYFTSGDATAVGIDPRLATRLSVSDGVRLINAFGISHQPPSFVAPVPGLTPGNLRGGLQSSFSSSGGVEVDVADDTTASLTAFGNIFFNMTDAIGTATTQDQSVADGVLDRRSLGSAVGLEVFVHRRLTKHLGGFVSYTLSRSRRTIDGQNFPSSFDRTHVANVALAYSLGANWRAGSRFVYYTGAPRQPSTDGTTSNQVDPGSVHPSETLRDPPFYRIDARLEKRWPIGATGWLSAVFEVMNATMHKEVWNGVAFGPVTIPSIGIEGGF